MPIGNNPRSRDFPRVPHTGELQFTGWFKPNGTSDPTSFDKSWIKSVGRSGVGAFTITLKDSMPVFRRLLGLQMHVQGPGESTIKSIAVSLSAKTITCQIYTAGAAADIAAGADNYAFVTLVVKADNTDDGSELAL
jgi:hypothetical protein